MWARPAFLTAEEMAFMAVSMELSSCVSSPVAPFTRRPFSITNRVSVSISVSKGVLSDIFAGYQSCYCLGWTRHFLAALRPWVAVLFRGEAALLVRVYLGVSMTMWLSAQNNHTPRWPTAPPGCRKRAEQPLLRCPLHTLELVTCRSSNIFWLWVRLPVMQNSHWLLSWKLLSCSSRSATSSAEPRQSEQFGRYKKWSNHMCHRAPTALWLCMVKFCSQIALISACSSPFSLHHRGGFWRCVAHPRGINRRCRVPLNMHSLKMFDVASWCAAIPV